MPLSAEKITALEEVAYQIRRLSVEMITYGRWGHIGGSFSLAELLAVLYFHAMHVKPDDPHWAERDRLILSKAHASPALYAAMALRGYFPIDALYTYCELGGLLEGHTDLRRTPGLESSGGPLGMGLSVAAGMALGLRFKGNPGPRVFCILGDGETNEGNVWEAAMSAAHYHLDNLIAIVDYNKYQLDGAIEDIIGLEPFADKWLSMGWHVREIDGHDLGAVTEGLDWATSQRGPACLIAHTVKGKGVSFMEGENAYHGVAPTEEELARALGELEGVLERAEDSIEREAAEAREAGQ